MKDNKSWILKMTCTVQKELIVEGCTEEQAESDPWNFCVEEIETDMVDWAVDSIGENK